jgi:hypothetical protein
MALVADDGGSMESRQRSEVAGASQPSQKPVGRLPRDPQGRGSEQVKVLFGFVCSCVCIV